MWKAIRKILDPQTANKVRVVNGLDIPFMRNRYDVAQLPAEFGGDRDHHIPQCIDAPAKFHGPFVPKAVKKLNNKQKSTT